MRTALLFAGVIGAVVAGGAIYYSQILHCPEIIVQRGRELDEARRERGDVRSCVRNQKLLIALANLLEARSTCAVRRMQLRESMSPPTPGELDAMVSELRGKVIACARSAGEKEEPPE